jgi:hypothetical protein
MSGNFFNLSPDLSNASFLKKKRQKSLKIGGLSSVATENSVFSLENHRFDIKLCKQPIQGFFFGT